MTKQIPLTQGKFALVDDEDYDFLIQWKWYYKTEGYAARNERTNKGRKTVRMHRVIMNTPHGMETDHADGNRLNNLKSNLRICTKSENQRNQTPKKHKHKGAFFDKHDGKWSAHIRINGKPKRIGRFSSEVDAARAYNKAAVEIYGEFAKLNQF